MYKRTFYDIEVTPAQIWAYPQYFEPTFVREIEPQRLMSASFLDEGEMWTTTLEEDYTQHNGKWTDKKIVKRIHTYLKQQQKEDNIILVGHNSDAFDIKMLNARFIFWGLEPLGHIEHEDTMKMAKKIGRFASYGLDYLCRHLGIGTKTGSHNSLWHTCLHGLTAEIRADAWEKMRIYNEQDVWMTLNLWHKLQAWVKTVNVDKYEDYKVCDSCGSGDYHCRGVKPLGKRFRKQYRCQSCTSHFTSDKTYKTYDEALSAPKGV